MLKRVPTGVGGLDPMIQGGFLERSLVLVAGPPGSGKTSLCCKYLEAGASVYNEKGLYVSLIESKEALLANLLQQFGKHFSDLEESGMIHILAFPSMKGEGLPAMMDSIMATIKDVGVKRLVIDSITALSQSFTNEYVPHFHPYGLDEASPKLWMHYTDHKGVTIRQRLHWQLGRGFHSRRGLPPQKVGLPRKDSTRTKIRQT